MSASTATVSTKPSRIQTGRVLVGTLRKGRPNGAGIYRLDRSRTLGKVLGGTGQSNGMAWSASGEALYWTCGTTKTICRCKYDPRRGTLTNRQVFHECMPDEGTPSGLAIDVEGTLWSARRDAGVILKIGENRRLMGQVTLPAKHVTSVAFGGADRRTVFVSAIPEEGPRKSTRCNRQSPGSSCIARESSAVKPYVPAGVTCAASPTGWCRSVSTMVAAALRTAVPERFFAAWHGSDLGVVEEAVDLVGQGREFVALHGDALFEQVVAVAVLLAGNGRDDDHGQSGGEAFGGGQAAGFADEEVGHLHPAMHFVGVAENAEAEAGIGRLDGAGLLFHVGLHLGVLAADDDGLRGMFQAGQAVEHARGGADPERAAGDEKERAVRVESGLPAQFGAIVRRAKAGSMGMPLTVMWSPGRPRTSR